jgi:phosphoserine aminotransferase
MKRSFDRRIYNFSSGPAMLPESVLHRAQDAIWNLEGTGIGVLEHSHRGVAFQEVLARTEARVRAIAKIPDDYAILFLQGGATSQFFMVPMNFLGGGTADFCDTGIWSQKAIKDAQRYGTAHVAASSAADRYTHVPETIAWSERAVYAHVTSNETIHGVQWPEVPTPPDGVPLICDASSDIFSRPIDVTRYGMIYAGAQKNLGPPGVVLVIIRKDLAEKGARDLPTILQYRAQIAEHSMLNTPNTFGIHMIGEVMVWLESRGGLAAIGAENAAKAKLLYDALDASSLFHPVVQPGSRSTMNIPFRSDDPALDQRFVEAAAEAGLDGLGGHRTVGGMRASLYNAFPIEGVRALVNFMQEFERTAS